jgi:hypothetical protein
MKTIKLLFLILFLGYFFTNCYSQNVLITDDPSITTPDGSSVLEIFSEGKGLLIPRMTTLERNAILIPKQGLMVYDTDFGGFYFYGANGWVNVSQGIWNRDNTTSTVYLANSTSKVVVGKYTTGDPTEPLFEVKNTAGQTVFAVYEEAVRVYVGNEVLKGSRGGFAVGGLAGAKGGSEYLKVYPDSTRINFNTVSKGSRGGFAVGGLAGAKSSVTDYMHVLPDSTRIYVETGAKGSRGGFAVGGLAGAKGDVDFFTYLTPENYFIGHKSGSKLPISGYGQYNSVMGYESALSLTKGNNNTFLGYQSGYTDTTGSNNVFLGYQSGYFNASGSENVFLGYRSGYSNLTSDNIAIGTNAGKDNQYGGSNVLIGNDVASNNSFGNWNVLIGNRTANGLEFAGTSNVMIGCDVGGSTTSGMNNVFLGDLVGTTNSTGSNNIFIGANSGKTNSVANNNIFVGSNSGYMNSSGEKNLFIGNNSGYTNGTGSYNVFLGNEAGYSNTFGLANVFLGENAGSSNTTGNQNVFLGNLAGDGFITGNNNVFLGNEVAKFRTGGEQNVIIGNQAGFLAGNGDYNIFLGHQAGYSNNGGDKNVFIGNSAGYSNQSGQVNTMIGFEAGKSSVNAHNSTYVGTGAGKFNTAGSNTFVGNSAGLANIIGTDNVSIGLVSGVYSLGNQNVFIGSGAGFGVENQGPGSGNVFIGYQAGKNEIGSNLLYIDNSSANDPLIKGYFVDGSEWLQVNGDFYFNKGANSVRLPLNRGTSGQVLTTNGAGLSYWGTANGSDAANGLNIEGTTTELGGTLNETTTITQGNYGMIYDLTDAGDFEVRDGGASNFYINEDGNIGIGTIGSTLAKVRIQSNSTNVYPQLEIAESVADDYSRLLFSNVAEGTNYWTVAARSDNTSSSSAFAINYSAIGDIIIANGSGNVGIGGDALTSSKLKVTANTTTTYPHLELTETVADDWSRIIFNNSVETSNSWTLSARADNTDASSTFNIYYSALGTNVLSVEGTGDVGIGTAPSYRLHVLDNTATNDDAAIYGDHTVTAGYGKGVYGAGYYMGVQGYVSTNYSSGVYGLYGTAANTGTGGGYGIYAAATGSNTGTNYGIYASATNASTNWAGYFSGNVFVNHPSGTSNGLSISNQTDADKWHMYMYIGNDLDLFLNGAAMGSFDGTTGAYSALSDKRLKKNIVPVDKLIDKLLKLEVVEYNFINQVDDQKYMGLLAQEVEKVFPYLVDHKTVNLSDGVNEDYYTLDYSGLSVIAIKAIQEQQVQIEELKKINENLQKQIDELYEKLK